MLYCVNYDSLNNKWSITFPETMNRSEIFTTGSISEEYSTTYSLQKVEEGFKYISSNMCQICLFVYLETLDNSSLYESLEIGKILIIDFIKNSNYPIRNEFINK
jgi:hypothetical protein